LTLGESDSRSRSFVDTAGGECVRKELYNNIDKVWNLITLFS
jgi:hypothetical protein